MKISARYLRDTAGRIFLGGGVIRQTLVTSVKIEKSQETKEHDDVDIIIVLVPRG